MKYSGSRFFLIAVFLFLSPWLHAGEKFLLNDFIRDVLEANPSLQAAQSRAEAMVHGVDRIKIHWRLKRSEKESERN